jgi:D-psicose/D-tagatose/L-ribulose 3-epimerase
VGFKYVVVSDTLPFLGHDVLEQPEEVIAAVKQAGYDGVDLPGNLERVKSAENLRRLVEAQGLVVPEVSGAWAWAYYGPGEVRNLAGPDESARQRGVECSKKLIDLAVVLGARFFPVCAIQPAIPDLPFPKTPARVLRANFLRSLDVLCKYAADRGITLVIEPLNRYEALDGVATTIKETLSLIEELGADNLGIQPDVFHMNVAETSICAALRDAGKHIRHMHINETNHHSLGTGHADYHAILKILKEVGYTGYLAVYMPFTTQQAWHRTGPGLNLLAYLQRALRYLKEIETAVDLQMAMYNPKRS